ncbi:MAG: glycosyltransferase family 2 protein [Aggregatilineales bacterium]
MPSLSIVIPVYNSENSILNVVNELHKHLPAITDNWEIIMVEDGSRDASWSQIEVAMQQDERVRGFRMMRNYGQHNALVCGVRHAQYELVITMDDDLQHPPEHIPTLLAHLMDDIDVVYGSPEKEQHGIFRDLASRVTKMVLQQAMGAETARNISAFRLFRTNLRDAFSTYQGSYVNIDVLLTWGTTRFTNVRVPHRERTAGESNYTFRKLLIHTFNMLTGFSVVPLQLASVLGFVMTGFGFLLLIYIITVRLFVYGYEVPGFTFLASLISIFAGTQMVMLGIMGEYLARMHFRLMDKPTYVVHKEQSTMEQTDV